MGDILKTPSWQSVAAGQTAILELPVGLTYERIKTKFTGATAAQLKFPRLLVNGNEIMRWKDVQRILDVNSYYDRADTAGYFTIWFNRPELINLVDQRVPGLGTADVQTLTLEIDVDAGAPASTLTSLSEKRAPEPLGVFVRVKEFPKNSAVSGEIEIADLPRGPDLLAVHFFKADVNNMTIEADYGTGTRLIYGKISKADGEEFQKDYRRVPVTAKATHVDFALQNDLAQGPLITRGMKDLRFRPDLGTSGNTDIVVESLDTFVGGA